MPGELSDEITEPSETDWAWLRQAEQRAEALLRCRYGNVVLTRDPADLDLAQRLIEDRILSAKDLLDLQCLGVVLGNVFVQHTAMRWVRIKNEFGDMLAIHSSPTSFTLYVLSMLSKRMEKKRKIDIPGLFRSFVADLGL
jgi:hypothetical protein